MSGIVFAVLALTLGSPGSVCAQQLIPEASVWRRHVRRDAPSRCAAVEGIRESAANLERLLNTAPPKDPASLSRRWEELGQLYALDSATLPLTVDALKRARVYGAKVSEDRALDVLAMLSMTQMRLGEQANCLLNHNSRSCIFPLSKEAQHKDKSGSEAARAGFMEYLEKRPDDAHIRWLLNIVHMTLGTYPDGVPARWRIDPKLFASRQDFPRFPDVAADAGLTGVRGAGGAVVEDFNGDGLLDVVLTSIEACDGVMYYENDGRGGYVDRSTFSGLSGQLNAVNAAQADFDNDGLTDLYLMRGAWESRGADNTYGTVVRNSLMRNAGGGRFVEVTDEVGLSKENTTSAAVWGDFDNDGWADLFVCNEQRAPDLYANRRGRFELVRNSGIEGGGKCKGAAWGDVDDDGWIDLFVANYKSENRLYRNRRDGTFERVRLPALEKRPFFAFPAFFFDYDNDGRQDLFVGALGLNTSGFARSLLGLPDAGEPPRLFRNLGGWRFQDVTREAGLERATMTMGVNVGDLDNDGWEDIYLGTGGFGFGDLVPNFMFRNREGKNFADVTTAGGFGNLQKGHGISFADVDNDGDQDVLAEFGGRGETGAYYTSLFENPGSTNSWITLRLEGRKANRSAIGTRIKAVITENGRRRELYRVVGSGGSYGSNSLQVELGLGKARRVDELEIVWAGSGTVGVYRDLEAGRFLAVAEGDPAPREITLLRFALRRKPASPHAHH